MKIKNRHIVCRALCIVLSLLMLLTVTPMTVFAEETESKTYKTGDIIEFGSYPQSEVTDSALKSALTAKAGSTDGWTSYDYYISGAQSDYMKYTDVEYGGAKYRGVYFTQYRPSWTTGSSSTDNSCQDDNGYNTSTVYWFKYEPMKWQVLSFDKTTGNAVVLSKDIIDSQQYYNNHNGRTIGGVTVYPSNYEHSDIRAWLNGTFYDGAFSEKEKNAIIATTLDNSAYSEEYSQYDSNSTTDKVWLLSYDEAHNSEYGFDTAHRSDSETRMAQGSAYALCQGLLKYSLNGSSFWRLRTAGYYFDYACGVVIGGCVDDGNVVYNTCNGVRPAINIHLTSEISPSEKYNVGDTVSFGSYPQSEVTDGELKAKLTELAGSTDGWTSYNYYISDAQSDYMKYTDVEYGGEKYRGVYFTQYRPYGTTNSSSTDNSWQNDNGYSTSTVYWFKYEPMKWQVLSFDKTTGNAVVLSRDIIDSQQYYYTYRGTRTIDGKTVYPNNYEHSDIRAWLNGTFYDGAFTASEKNAIIATTLDNSAYSEEYSQYDSNSTTDKVWLLSYDEAHNADYGFDTEHWSDSETRMAQGSAYALCQGLWKYIPNGCSFWRLRSAGDYYYYACCVDSDGYVSDDNHDVSKLSDGVRPALNIHLTSEISPACEHTWQEKITLPTCTKGGYTNHFCTKCSASYKDNYTNALGHDWDYTNVKVIKAATCTEPGEDEYTCKRCHETHIRYSSYADHDWGEWVVTTPATVDNYGVKTRKCKNCDATDTETIEKLTVSEITVNKNADNVKNFEGFVAAVPGVGADKIIAATGGSTKIYKDGKEVVFDEKTKPATGMQIVILCRDIVVMGDIDCNGEISVGDARLALRAAVGLDVISGAVQAAASISHGLDEAVGVSDARLILRAAVSLDNPSDWMKNK